MVYYTIEVDAGFKKPKGVLKLNEDGRFESRPEALENLKPYMECAKTQIIDWAWFKINEYNDSPELKCMHYSYEYDINEELIAIYEIWKENGNELVLFRKPTDYEQGAGIKYAIGACVRVKPNLVGILTARPDILTQENRKRWENVYTYYAIKGNALLHDHFHEADKGIETVKCRDILLSELQGIITASKSNISYDIIKDFAEKHSLKLE